MKNLRRKERRGFTLIELMIVIAIIGVLAAIAVPNFQAARRKANSRACYANMKTISGALEMYNLDFNVNGSLEGSGAEGTNVSYEALKTGGYLQSIPRHPGTNELPGSGIYTMNDQGVLQCGTDVEGTALTHHGTIQAD